MHIDWWTLALQTVNVLVLIWILARFFFRPVVDIVAKRQAGDEQALGRRRCCPPEAADARADADKARAEIAAERDRLIAEARRSARWRRQNLHRASRRRRSPSCTAKPKRRSPGTEQQRSRRSSLARANSPSKLRSVCLRAFRIRTCSVRIPRWALPGAARTVIRAQRESLAVGRGEGCMPIEVVTAAPLSRKRCEHVRDALKRRSVRELPLQFRS